VNQSGHRFPKESGNLHPSVNVSIGPDGDLRAY